MLTKPDLKPFVVGYAQIPRQIKKQCEPFNHAGSHCFFVSEENSSQTVVRFNFYHCPLEALTLSVGIFQQQFGITESAAFYLLFGLSTSI